MTLCPVCNARLQDSRECHRCKTDIGHIIDIKTQSIDYYNKAAAAFKENHFYEMFFYAKRSVNLFYTPESAKLLASASILINKYEFGCFLWSKLNRFMVFI